MAETNLHPEGPDAIGELSDLERACILALRADAASRVPLDPEALRIRQEQAELRAMTFAARNARAVRNVAAILHAINLGEMLERVQPKDGETMETHWAALDLLRAARIELATVGSGDAPGWDDFGDVLAKHGLCLFEPTEPESAVLGRAA